ncbi:AAA family ATPase [Nonomuraea sp. H19]|uniref:AAA family ATPase n=1 Tax=Nonomuraea sp. H19 TaxID=3452206 RepID=UPI003F88888E
MTTGSAPPPHDRNDHCARPDGGDVVATEALQMTYANLKMALEERAMACMYGDSGLGKTAMVNAALRYLAPEETVHMSDCRPRRMRDGLFDALGLQRPRPRNSRECDNLLKTTLAERSRVVVCDNADWLPADCFEWWCHLWDDRHTETAIVFVGRADCFEVLAREPARILLWQEFKRMTLAEVLRVIPAYHPIWADADAKVIKLADRRIAHGNWRVWAYLTAHAVNALEQLQRRTVDEDVLRWALDRLCPRWPV